MKKKSSTRKQSYNIYQLELAGGLGDPGGIGTKGGEGGQGGQCGYDGAIIFEKGGQIIVDDGPTIYVAVNKVRDGDKGNDGLGGKHGKTGKISGDVGFIHSVNWRKPGGLKKYYGFDTDVRLEIRDGKCGADSEPSVRLFQSDGTKRWVHLAVVDYDQPLILQQVMEKTKQQKTRQLAVKKRDINRAFMLQTNFDQLFAKHLDELIEEQCYHIRSSMTMAVQQLNQQLIRPSMPLFVESQSTSTIYHPNLVNNKESIVFSYKFHPDTHYDNSVKDPCTAAEQGCEECKKKIDESAKEFEVSKSILSLKELSSCLEWKETRDDPDNIFHCLFGEMNSSGIVVCQNGSSRRQILSHSIIKSVEGNTLPLTLYSAVHKFVFDISKDSFLKATAAKDRGQLSNNDALEIISDEYGKQFICDSKQKLGCSELHLLALAENVTIHVYEKTAEDDKTRFCFKETINVGNDKEHFVLFTPNCWQRLEINIQQKAFREKWKRRANFHQQLTESKDVKSFKSLINWFKLHEKKGDQFSKMMTKHIKKIDPDFGAPAHLSKHLEDRLQQLHQLQNDSNGLISLPKNVTDYYEETKWVISKLVSFLDSMPYLVSKVVECILNSDDDTLILHSHIISRFCPHQWKYEFFLLQIEKQFQTVLPTKEKDEWRKLVYSLTLSKFSMLWHHLIPSADRSLPSLEILKKVLFLYGNFMVIQPDLANALRKISLDNWIFELKNNYWFKQLGNSNKMKVEPYHVFRAINDHLLELENKIGFEKSEQIFEDFNNSSSNGEQFLENLVSNLFGTAVENRCRTYDEIVHLMSEDNRNNHQTSNLDGNCVDDFISEFDNVVESLFLFRLRDAQRVTIKSFLENNEDRNRLAQVSTGEGKSLIVAAIAIYYVTKKGRKVDIITSNSVLAKRDSTESNGVVEIYKRFEVSVANNCSSSEEERKEAYCMKVVYGTLSDYQRDHLLDVFYGRKIKGHRSCDFIIVDEVDW